MIRMVNKKERLHADGNTHRIIEGQESSDFSAALHRKKSSEDKVGEKQIDAFLERPLAKSLPTKD